MSRRQPGRSTGHDQPGPSQPRITSHHNPIVSDPAQLVDHFSHLHLGPPPPDSLPGSDGGVSAELLRFFVLDKVNMASKFLANFSQGQAGNNRRETFLRWFTVGEAPNGLYAGGGLIDNVRRLVGNNAGLLRPFFMHLASLKSATQILDANIPEPLIDPTQSSSSSKSSGANDLFMEDPILIQNLPASTTLYYDQTCQAFNSAIKKLDRVFYDDPLEKWVRLEADVTYVTILDQGFPLTLLPGFRDASLVNILVPVLRVMNSLLEVWYTQNRTPEHTRKFIWVRAQFRSQENRRKSDIDASLTQYSRGTLEFVDHALVLARRNNWTNRQVLVSVEYKVSTSLQTSSFYQ
jgi:hypothetical protein